MAKPSKDKDRRAVVEQMRREQKRAEKRRTYAIVAGCGVVALAIIAIPAWQLFRTEQIAAGDLDTLGPAAGQAGCQEIVTKPATGGSDHREIGSPIAYQDAPPAFGPHYPTTAGFERKFYSPNDRPEVPYLVHNLEHGYTMLWYDETIADDAEQLAVVRGIAENFEGDDFENKFVAAPWTEEDGAAFPDGAHVALTHWSVGNAEEEGAGDQQGIWQYCTDPSGAAVAEFAEQYPYTDSPEPDAL